VANTRNELDEPGWVALTPVNVFVCFELQKIEPDLNKIAVWVQRYFYAVAMQGMMQGGEAVTVMGFLQLGPGARSLKKWRPPSIIATALAVPKIAANNERLTRRRPIDGPGC